MTLTDTFCIYSNWGKDSVAAQVDSAIKLIERFAGLGNCGLWPEDGQRVVIADGQWGTLDRADTFTGPKGVKEQLGRILTELAGYMSDSPEDDAGSKEYAHTMLDMEISDNTMYGGTCVELTYGDTTYCTIQIMPLVSDIDKEEAEMAQQAEKTQKKAKRT